MGKIIYLEDYLRKQEVMQNSIMNDEPEFTYYSLNISIPFEEDPNEIAFMQSVNAEIPSWLRKVVRFVTSYAYPSKGDDRCFYIWDLRKDIYDFLGYRWYSPADIHPNKYSF